MNLALFKIKTMDGQEFEQEAFTQSQAITLWTNSKSKDLLFRSCILVKSTPEIDRYWELNALTNPSKNDIKEIDLIVDNFRATELFKKNKKFFSFKRIPDYLNN